MGTFASRAGVPIHHFGIPGRTFQVQAGGAVFVSPPFYGTNIIRGITRDANGNSLPRCIVKLFATASDALQAQTISDENGNYNFFLGQTAAFFYVVAYKVGTPDVAGTTVNTLPAYGGGGGANSPVVVISNPTFRSASTDNTTQIRSTPLNPALPAGALATDVLIMFISVDLTNTDDIAAPSGWTLIRRTDAFTNGQPGTLASYWALGNVASRAFTSVSSNAAAIAGCLAIQYANNLAPIQASSGEARAGDGANSVVRAPSLTAAANNLNICSWLVRQGDALGAIPGGYTEQYDVSIANPLTLASGTLSVSSGATGNQDRTEDSSFNNRVGQQVCITA